VAPTALALSVADAARRMAEGADAFALGAAGRRGMTGGTVRITTSDVAAVWLLPPLLAELQEREPQIQIELVASNGLTNLLRREADIAVRMVRPTQTSLVARKLGDIRIVAAAHQDYLAREGTPRQPKDLLNHRLIGFDRDDSMLRGFAAMGFVVTREQFVLRTDDQVAYAQLLRAGGGIGFVAAYCAASWPGVQAVLPKLALPLLPCWLAVHREIRGNPLVRRVYDFLAEALPPAISRSM
jgi:DNA-binding transcriptional LysR family regulator